MYILYHFFVIILNLIQKLHLNIIHIRPLLGPALTTHNLYPLPTFTFLEFFQGLVVGLLLPLRQLPLLDSLDVVHSFFQVLHVTFIRFQLLFRVFLTIYIEHTFSFFCCCYRIFTMFFIRPWFSFILSRISELSWTTFMSRFPYFCN